MQSMSLKQLVQESIAEARQQALTVPIQLNDDASLNAFVKQVLSWAQQEQVKADIECGRVQFTLSGKTEATTSSVAAPSVEATTLVIQQGVITESKIRKHGGANVRHVQVSKQVVVTPSARDCLRQLNITLERLES